MMTSHSQIWKCPYCGQKNRVPSTPGIAKGICRCSICKNVIPAKTLDRVECALRELYGDRILSAMQIFLGIAAIIISITCIFVILSADSKTKEKVPPPYKYRR